MKRIVSLREEAALQGRRYIIPRDVETVLSLSRSGSQVNVIRKELLSIIGGEGNIGIMDYSTCALIAASDRWGVTK